MAHPHSHHTHTRSIRTIISSPQTTAIIIMTLLGWLIWNVRMLYLVYRAPAHSAFIPDTSHSSGSPMPILRKEDAKIESRSIFYPDHHFTLRIPPTCRSADQHIICVVDTYNTVTLIPETMGTVSHTIEKRDIVTIQGRTWYRTYAVYREHPFVTYGTNEDGIYYLLEAEYQTRSERAERQIEEIISTFQPLLP